MRVTADPEALRKALALIYISEDNQTYSSFTNNDMAPHLFLSLLALIAGLASCQTNSKLGKEYETATATLLWTGEIAADGCGFEVVIDGKKYLPANEEAIDASFKSRDSTQVQLEFERLPNPIDRQCGMLPQPRVMDAIRVVSISQP